MADEFLHGRPVKTQLLETLNKAGVPFGFLVSEETLLYCRGCKAKLRVAEQAHLRAFLLGLQIVLSDVLSQRLYHTLWQSIPRAKRSCGVLFLAYACKVNRVKKLLCGF